MTTGRNEPCPCGSGLKYKKCCLKASEPQGDELLWQRLNSSRNKLTDILLKHLITTYGIVAFHEAWQEFHLFDDEELSFDPDSIEVPVFMAWFAYCWFPDPDCSEVDPSAPMGQSPAASLLERRSSRLEPLQIEYAQECLTHGFTFIEILEVWPGQGFKAVDILTGEHLDIVEKRGSECAQPYDLMFALVVTCQGLSTIEGCSAFKIEPIYKPGIIDLREYLQQEYGKITHDVLRENDIDVIAAYQGIRHAVFDRRLPLLENTDGDAFIPHTLTFDIESVERAFEALYDLCVGQSKADLLEQAERGEDGQIKRIEFPWLKLGNSKNKSWDNTVLGQLVLEGKTMTVQVNSAERAALFEKEAGHRLDGIGKLRSTVVDPIEEQLKDAEDRSLPDTDDLNNQPEVQAMLAEMTRRHWEGWIDTPIPALGNETPLEAAQTRVGRETLDALLHQFERQAARNPLPGQTPETFQQLRERLGLEKG